MRRRVLQLLIAACLDLLVGDPESMPHPVRWLGSLIERIERRTYDAYPGAAGGAVLALSVLAVSLGCATLVMRAARRSRFAGLAAGSLLIYYSISFRQLIETALEVRRLLEGADLEGARRMVGILVGRDTAPLDEADVVRAVVESVAENASDGVTAPALYAVACGPVAAFAYRVVNTLDSMVGYRDGKYESFGTASARLDDAANLVPARLTAATLLLAGALRGGGAREAARLVLRDAPKHESPNAGWPEAAMAGLLGVRLGGVDYFGGVPTDCVYLGEETVPLSPAGITGAVRLVSLSYALLLAALSVIALILGRKK